eukprot:EC719952.1.p1 GENE.EC719952.1~~EC719952.1.p1  ORF type:complete len:91 (+),score=16.06 EC719952.1:46-318(+)
MRPFFALVLICVVLALTLPRAEAMSCGECRWLADRISDIGSDLTAATACASIPGAEEFAEWGGMEFGLSGSKGCEDYGCAERVCADMRLC